jgi:hypothetical protein
MGAEARLGSRFGDQALNVPEAPVRALDALQVDRIGRAHRAAGKLAPETFEE